MYIDDGSTEMQMHDHCSFLAGKGKTSLLLALEIDLVDVLLDEFVQIQRVVLLLQCLDIFPVCT